MLGKLSKFDKLGLFIALTGLTIRILFLLFGASIFYGSDMNFYIIHGDTNDFFSPVYNFIHNGIYSGNLAHPNGVASRMPGYPSFLGLFYLVSGCNKEISFVLVSIFQIVVDSICIFLLFKSVYNILTIELTTHDAGGITDLDIKLAKSINSL